VITSSGSFIYSETVSVLLQAPRRSKIPAVIKWDKPGKEVFISGTFNNWEKKIPLVKR